MGKFLNLREKTAKSNSVCNKINFCKIPRKNHQLKHFIYYDLKYLLQFKMF